MNWYQRSYEQVKRVYGEDCGLFCALLAMTSPNSTIAANTTLARKAYNQIKSHGTITRSGYIKCHYEAIVRYMRTGEMRGRKVRAFFSCLTNAESQTVPVDIWMMRLYGHTKDTPTRKQYDEIEADIVAKAHAMNKSPRDYQAELWAKIRGNGSSYAEYCLQGRLF